MTQPEYRFFYVRAEPSLAAKTAFALVPHKPHKTEPLGFPVACVAYTLHDENTKGSTFDELKHVEFAFATHNPTDTYSRDAAKAWAIYYLLVKSKYRGNVSYYHDKGLIVKTRIMELLTLPGTPLRVQKAARYWLGKHTKPSRLQPHKPSKVDAPLGPSGGDLEFVDPTKKKGPQLVSRKRKK